MVGCAFLTGDYPCFHSQGAGEEGYGDGGFGDAEGIGHMLAVGSHLAGVFLLQSFVRFLLVGVELVGLEVDDVGGGYSAAGIILSKSTSKIPSSDILIAPSF